MSNLNELKTKLSKLFVLYRQPRAISIALVVFVVVSALVVFTFLHDVVGKDHTHTASVSGISSLQTGVVRQSGSQTVQNSASEQLADISDKLANIEQQLNVPAAPTPVDLGSVKQPLAALQNKMDSLTSQTNEIAAAIKANTGEVSKQMLKLEQELQSVGGVHHEVDASSLPFSVQSIDNIQESNVVTVQFNHTFLPLVAGDSISGWTLIGASNTNQSAEFKNANNDYVDIDLKRAVPGVIPVCGHNAGSISGKGDC